MEKDDGQYILRVEPKEEGDWFWLWETRWGTESNSIFIELQVKGQVIRVFKDGTVIVEKDDEDQDDFDEEGNVDIEKQKADEAEEDVDQWTNL